MEEQITVKTGFDLMEFKFFYRQLVLACFFFMRVDYSTRQRLV
jgi:hypothetical protein